MNLAADCQTSSMQQLFFLSLFEAWVARCSPNSVFGRAQKSLGTADVTIVASGVFKGRRARHLPRAPPFWGPPYEVSRT